MDKLNNYVSEIINGSVLNIEPFPFIYVENIFPQEFYNELCLLAPQNDELTLAGANTNNKMHTAVVKSRYTYTLLFNDISLLPNGNRLNEIVNWFKYFLMPTIGKKIQINYDVEVSSLRGAFVRDEVGYRKKPHTDHPNKLFTMLLYMSDHPTSTTILKPKQQDFIDPKGVDHDYKYFEDHISLPFKSNSALILARTNNSFHCVKEVTSDLPRKALHVHIWKI